MKRENTVADRTTTYLEEFLYDVFWAIEFGNAYALAQFEADSETIHSTRLFETMRYKTRLKLQEKEYQVADLPLHGLHVWYKGYDIKIFKAGKNGEVPIAGKSKKRLQFYNHNYGQCQFDLDNMRSVIEELGLEDRLELIILYKVSYDGTFQGIDLVCTERADYPYGIPELAWRSSISHPATASNTNNPYTELPTDLGNIDTNDGIDDLDIFKDGTND